MICKRCGFNNADAAFTCSQCGAVLVERGLSGPGATERVSAAGAPETSKLAVASLILGIASFVCFSFVTGVPAVITGVLAILLIAREGGRVKGMGLAVAGTVLGVLSVLAVLIPLIFLFRDMDPEEREIFGKFLKGDWSALVDIQTELSVEDKIKVAQANQLSIATSLEAYYIDHNVYPRRLEPFLTTPIAYILPPNHLDPFTDAPMTYHPKGGGWILISDGPDGLPQIDPAEDYETDYKDNSRLILKTYDPSNGTLSDGDIYRVR
jgi:hypothetical protein